MKKQQRINPKQLLLLYLFFIMSLATIMSLYLIKLHSKADNSVNLEKRRQLYFKAQRPLKRKQPNATIAAPSCLPFEEYLRILSGFDTENPVILKIREFANQQNRWNRSENFEQRNFVAIRGAFSSGTGWLRKLLSANCPTLVTSSSRCYFSEQISHHVDEDGVYGWKHGLFLDKEVEMFRRISQHRLVIISREAFSWVVSTWKMHARTKKKNPPKIQQFVNDIRVNDSAIPPWKFFEELYYIPEIRHQYSLQTDNILKARTLLYKNWFSILNNEDISDRIIFVRYEDLRKDAQGTFGKIAKSLGLDCRDQFNLIESRVKMGKIENTRPSPLAQHPRKEFCTFVKDESLYQDILSKLDLKFEEEKLGYVYERTRASYCKDVSFFNSIKY